MSELRLVGLHEDGEHVVLEGADGQRFRLPIDEALRAAVRRDRPQLEQVRAEATGALPPREIQARIRAGATAEDVADGAGMPLELVRRYTGPVLAEREYVAQQARATRVGHEPDSPELGDLVTDRLATRGVEAGSIRWDSYRIGSAPWTVEITFEVTGADRSARWTYDPGARTVRAIDDEARWLSETELSDGPIPRRHLAAVPGSVFDVEVDDALRPLLAAVDPAPVAPEPDAEEVARRETDALLEDLNGRRGVRQQLELDDEDEEFEGFGPQHTFDFDQPELTGLDAVPAAHPPHSRPDLATDATVLQMPGAASRGDATDHTPADTGQGGDDDAHDPAPGGDSPAPTPQRPRSRKGRASVPSWDEIVFGAKPE